MTLLVLEGCDFSGKTTTIMSLKDLLKDTVFFLRDPGSSDVAEGVRSVMKKHPVDVRARQLLMHGCRVDMLSHYNNFEDENTLYFVDRWTPSTIVYGTTDGVPWNVILGLLGHFPVPEPHTTFILDPGWDALKDRVFSKARSLDELEGTLSRLKEIHDRYERYHKQGFFSRALYLKKCADPVSHILEYMANHRDLTKFVK